MLIEARTRLYHGVIAQKRRELGLTQKELADMVGVSQTSIWNVEALRQMCSLNVASKLANVLGCSLDDIISVKLPEDIPRLFIRASEIHELALQTYAEGERQRALSFSGALGNREDILSMKEIFYSAIGKAELTDREVFIIEERYGLNGKEPHTLKEIGMKVKLTRDRVRQISEDAIRKVKAIIENEDFLSNFPHNSAGLNVAAPAERK